MLVTDSDTHPVRTMSRGICILDQKGVKIPEWQPDKMEADVHQRSLGGRNMAEVVVEGTLKPDGTLELDARPNLPPGRVTVILQSAQIGVPGKHGLAEVIDKIYQGQQARGFVGRSAEDIQAGLRESEEEYQRRMDAVPTQTKAGPGAKDH